jgi:hypothetical protein
MKLINTTLTVIYNRGNVRKIQVLQVFSGSVINVSLLAAERLGMRYDNKLNAVHVRGNIPLEVIKEVIESETKKTA